MEAGGAQGWRLRAAGRVLGENRTLPEGPTFLGLQVLRCSLAPHPEALNLPSAPQDEKQRLSRNMSESSLGSSDGKQPPPSRDATGAQPSTAGTPHNACQLGTPSLPPPAWLGGGNVTFPSPYSPKQHPALVSWSRAMPPPHQRRYQHPQRCIPAEAPSPHPHNGVGMSSTRADLALPPTQRSCRAAGP